MAAGLPGSGLFGHDPAEQVVPADGVPEGGVVAGHAAPDVPVYLVVAVSSGYEPALASDQLRHRAPPPCWLTWASYCQDVGVTLASSPPVRIQICGPLAIERDGQRVDALLHGWHRTWTQPRKPGRAHQRAASQVRAASYFDLKNPGGP